MTPEDYLQHIDFAATTKLDFTPLFTEPKSFARWCSIMSSLSCSVIDKVACPESMGFFLAPPSQQS